MISKEKRVFFTTASTDLLHTSGAKDKAWVPGPDNYMKAEVWTDDPTHRFDKFLKNKRTTVAGELEIKNKKPETSSPGPAAYNNHEAKLKNLNKTIGMYTYRQKRKNYFDSMVELSIESHVMPGKYNATDPVSNL
jgi:hypothetical protein